MASTNARNGRMEAIIEAIAVEMGIVDPLTGDFTEKYQTGPRTRRITHVRGVPLVNTMGQPDEVLRDNFGLDDEGIAEVRRAQAYPFRLADPENQAKLDELLAARAQRAEEDAAEREKAAEAQRALAVEAARAAGEEAQAMRVRMGMPVSDVRRLQDESYRTPAGEGRRVQPGEEGGPAVAPEPKPNSEETEEPRVAVGNRSTTLESPLEAVRVAAEESVTGKRRGRPPKREDFLPVEEDDL